MEMIIGISYNIMSESKRNLSRARDDSQEENIKLNNAKSTLESSGSPRLRMSAEAISDQVRNVITRIDNIDKVTAGIDYAVRRFQEVDEACASRIKNTGLEFRRVAGLLNNKEKFRVDPIGSIMSGGEKAWNGAREGVSGAWDKTRKGVGKFWDENGEYITNTAIIVGEGIAIGFTVAALAAGTLTGVTEVIAVVGLVYGVASMIDSGIKIKETYCDEEVDGFNFIEKGLVAASPEHGEDIYAVSTIAVAFASLGVATVGASKATKGIGNIYKELATGEENMKIAQKASEIAKHQQQIKKITSAKAINKYNRLTGIGKKGRVVKQEIKNGYDTMNQTGKVYEKAKQAYSASKSEIEGLNSIKIADEARLASGKFDLLSNRYNKYTIPGLSYLEGTTEKFTGYMTAK